MRAATSSTKEGRLAIEAFFRRFMPTELRGPPKVLQADGHSFSDVAAKVVSIINLASVAAIETVVGVPVHPLRFRANLYVEGWPAWHEFEPARAGDRDRRGAAEGDQADRALRRRPTSIRTPASAISRFPRRLMQTFDHADCGDLRAGDRGRRDRASGRRDQSVNASGRATCSSGLRSAATPQRHMTAAAAIISAAPSR